MSHAPQTHLLHYRLMKKLGQGGMGEVWQALDTKLDREVAIKVLPEAVASDPERIARLQREARAVARLSHPNIVTVYAVEEAAGVSFVAMEMVRGRTLAELIPRNGFGRERLLDLAIPLADAVAAAHLQGVTHRDLKPGNVMLGEDGRIKVLDFGLAKMLESRLAREDVSRLPTETVTAQGRILGTVDYMSPEQAEGKAVDHRSDIFSLGIILFEMATGTRPFRGDTPAATLSSILKDNPPSVTEVRSSLPRDLGRMIRRCLQKDPERRYQSAQDLRTELEDLRAELESGEWGQAEEPRRRRHPGVVGFLGLVGAAVGLLLVGYALRDVLWPAGGGREDLNGTAALTRLVPLTRSGRVDDVAISPDGRYVFYVPVENGLYSLRVRQLATGSDQELVPPGEEGIFSPESSPDLAWIYYGQTEGPSAVFAPPEKYSSGIYRIPFLGGRPQRILEDVGGSFALSPDGNRIAFNRVEGVKRLLLVAAADGSDVRTIASTDFSHLDSLAWTTDGERIIFVSQSITPGPGEGLGEVALAGGEPRLLGTETWAGIWSLVALPDGRGFIVSGNRGAYNYQLPAQIWQVDPAGRVRERITSDLESYESLSLDRTGKSLVATQIRSEHSVWVLPQSEGAKARRVSFTSQSGPYWAGIAWLPDGSLLYENLEGESLQIWKARPDGSGRERITTAGTFNMGASVSPDGATLAYFSNRSGGFRIWLADADGANARRLTQDAEEEVFPRFSPDGRWIVYHVLPSDGAPMRAMRAPAGGGPGVALRDRFSVFPVVSPQGDRLAFGGTDPEDGRFKILVADFETGRIQTRIEHAFTSLAYIGWTPDGKGVAAAGLRGGATNLLVYPLDGGPARQITHFTEGEVLGFGWSRDGGDLAVVHVRRSRDAVLITGLNGRSP